MKISNWFSLFFLLLSATHINATWAHVFDIAIISTYSGTQASEGQSLWQGMRVATREADGHPDETSDGHLGGVDSNLLRVDSTRGATSISDSIRKIAAQQGTAIVVLDNRFQDLDKQLSAAASIVILTRSQAGALPANVILPTQLSDSRLKQFSVQYRQQYGLAPDSAARAGYISARLIAKAMRRLNNELEDQSRVQRVFIDARGP